MGDALVRTQRFDEGSVVVEVLGPLEAETVGALRSVLLDAIETWRPRSLAVDLRRVPFMDSMGIGTLVAGSNAAREAGGALEVRNPSPFVHRLLHITGLTELFGLPALPETESPSPSLPGQTESGQVQQPLSDRFERLNNGSQTVNRDG
jgi:anti-anti-sigma factor